ncbi:T6SS immunity protein Tdi1 domain-containing protein [Pelagicoccus sp. SDUM812005]|uniref:T6SS immunity protein Tdi1 domain-containing protein n=1 Tax=Pelagicoccus sp. SDUM812005 TaxID=3041257 RepID=UPI00280DC30D|nr:T6SS immunity protein Tdi1 domain-containing protein [Pelagicoccus sp. SDUM812005]MDQ8183895.1 DUF1851 domain-containing protein [Pelagicoccus sp. SDUM812005]
MNVNDYLIDPANRDWNDLLDDWKWILPNKFTPWLVNRFGDIFMVLSDGTVHMLDVGAGRLDLLANDRNDFCTKLDEDQNADEWLLISLVDSLTENGMKLNEDECYSFITQPGLGGEYEKENVKVYDISVHYAVTGQIFEQIKDIPDGTKITFNYE